ncbi:uncharacterized protein LOC141689122 isoform X2 [Apium graveolens]|uniref:uncharacterized protein LOC141689122 isoform X2 n=1 Tax=Apium graveolens TaxID=4045 RepID=UPI003D7B7265
MATSNKFDLSSASPDRPLYASGQRGSYMAASFVRSSSFRENVENPILSALPSMSRSTSSVTQGDVMSFLQCLRFDPKAIIVDHKLNRQGEFKRFAGLAIGIQPDESPSSSTKSKVASVSPEELKRFRIGLRESSIKARERVKIFNEGLLVVNKCFPSIPSRKRSRPDVLSGERPSALFASDRSAVGAGAGKLGPQSHALPSGFELDQQKPEERSKNVIPSKRTRTSMVDPRIDVRPSTPARTPGTADRDNKEGLRFSSNSIGQADDQNLAIGGDGWEKSKMKKKRSVIKAEMAPSSPASKAVDGYREPKQGALPRLLSDGRPRSSDSYAYRANTREEFSSGSPTSSAKLNAAPRAPRSSSGIVPKLSPVIQRATAAKDWEVSHCTSKNSVPVGASNRKRTPSAQASSPPVAQWASHRPQKMSRTARRTNLVPIIPSNEETTSLDTISDVAGSENGLGFPRRVSGNSPQQVKLKGEVLPTATLESEESGAAETKSSKSKKSDELDDKSGKKIQKLSPLLLPPRKNKVASREDLGDGVRRQGRTGRGFTSTRSLAPLTEKYGNMGTAKQLRSAKLGFDKTESKAGRPPTRKLSDRKAYTRQKHTTVNAAADFLVGSDDGHEELLAAANAVSNPAHALSSSFWRQMEPLFGFVSDGNMTFLKEQRDGDSIPSTPNAAPLGSRGFGMFKRAGDMYDTNRPELSPEDAATGTGMSSEISLCQILLSALITEDVDEEHSGSGNEEMEFNIHESEFEPDGQIEAGYYNNGSIKSFELSGRNGCNGYKINSCRSYDDMEHDVADKNTLSRHDMWSSSGFDLSQNGFHPDHSVVPVFSCSDVQYNKMSFNERAVLEIQSIGLSPERVPDLVQTGEEEITRDISLLEDKYHDQVCRKKEMLDKLFNSATKARELQEKGFQQAALDKLVGMAYQKYMSCWGPNAPGGKSASGKMAKQAALAFVKRTLDRCQQFEITGNSCFSEPLFREMFLSRLSQFSDAQQLAASTDGESGKFNCIDGRISGVHSQQSPSLSNNDMYSFGPLSSMNSPAERTIGNEDTWSNRVKERELLLDDVVGGVVRTSLSSSAKGKRSDRDREGKGNSREFSSRNGTTKLGRPTSGSAKGERKYKSKPKQKTTQLSAVNGLIAKVSEQPKTGSSSMPNPGGMRSSNDKEKNNFNMDMLATSEAIDLSNMDALDVPVDLGDQGEDIDSWFGIDDDGGLQDNDFMGLEIPMDDLSELNMMV